MKKETKMKLMTGALVVTMAASTLGMTPAYAETGTKKQGTIVETQLENGQTRNVYVVKEGDNLSRISEKLCRKVYGIEPTTKYWPVLAFMNGYPRVAQPGDEMIYPETLDEMEARLDFLKKSGLYGKYVRQNNIYKKKFKVKDLLNDIFGSTVCVDPDFINQYLTTLGLEDKYNADTVIDTVEELWNLTEWIPSLPQMYSPEYWYLFSDLEVTDENAWMFQNPDAEVENVRTK